MVRRFGTFSASRHKTLKNGFLHAGTMWRFQKLLKALLSSSPALVHVDMRNRSVLYFSVVDALGRVDGYFHPNFGQLPTHDWACRRRPQANLRPCKRPFGCPSGSCDVACRVCMFIP